MTRQLVLALLAAVASGQSERSPNPREIFERAVNHFFEARIAEANAGFDQVAKLVPAEAPHLWQRGIALYYAGRFADCRAQFENHRTVNPADVENAAWHFLCVARGESPAKARAELLPVGPDSRRPMSEVYAMFQGKLTPRQVIAAAGDDVEANFYAQLYAGLYYEAMGDKSKALDHMRVAAADRYAVGGYMHRVAKVHLRVSR